MKIFFKILPFFWSLLKGIFFILFRGEMVTTSSVARENDVVRYVAASSI